MLLKQIVYVMMLWLTSKFFLRSDAELPARLQNHQLRVNVHLWRILIVRHSAPSAGSQKMPADVSLPFDRVERT